MYVCICNAITEKTIRDTVATGSTTIRELRQQLGVGSSCGRCTPCARDVLHYALLLKSPSPMAASSLQYPAA